MTLHERIAKLEDEIIRAFNERDRNALILAQMELKEAREEKERRDFDTNWTRLAASLKPDPEFYAAHNLN